MKTWRQRDSSAQERSRKYQRDYQRERRADPVKGKKLRKYHRLYARELRSDPARREQWLAAQRKEARKRRRERKAWFREYRKTLKCARCGSKRRLQFHHREIKPDNQAVSELITQGRNLKRIMEEIAKCDVLCHPCHHKEHTALRRAAKAIG